MVLPFWYRLTRVVLDKGPLNGRVCGCVCVVQVVDANDHAPTFARSLYEVAVREDAPLGTTVVRVSAVDPDAAGSGRVRYGRVDDRAGTSPFDVDRDSGDVVLAAALDRERAREHLLGVAASDSPAHGPPLSGYARVVVRVLDANDHPPSLTVHSLRPDHPHRFSVAENAPAGSFVAHLSVSDRDSGPNGRVGCRLTRGDDAFQLIELSGVVEYKLVSSRVFDREQRDAYSVTVTCSVSVQSAVSLRRISRPNSEKCDLLVHARCIYTVQ